jgi:hypothetical protein
MMRITRVPVECSVLGLEKRQQATSNKGLSIQRCSQVVRRVATCGNVGDVDDGSECILGSVLVTFVLNIVLVVHLRTTYVIQTGRDQKVLMIVIASACPEMANLLRLDIGDLERWAVDGRSG